MAIDANHFNSSSRPSFFYDGRVPKRHWRHANDQNGAQENGQRFWRLQQAERQVLQALPLSSRTNVNKPDSSAFYRPISSCSCDLQKYLCFQELIIISLHCSSLLLHPYAYYLTLSWLKNKLIHCDWNICLQQKIWQINLWFLTTKTLVWSVRLSYNTLHFQKMILEIQDIWRLRSEPETRAHSIVWKMTTKE